MTILATVYASAPTDELLIPTLEIRVPGLTSLRICNGYEDHYLYVDGVRRLFEAGPLSVALPAKNTTGQQTIRFGVSGVNGVAQQYVDAALAADGISTMVFREYLLSDTSAPARKPYVMTIVGGGFEGSEATFEGSYYDLLNSAWPRERYTAQTAPGIRFL